MTVNDMDFGTIDGYCAYVTTMKDLHKHSNADRLQCATIFGNNVIVNMNYYNGQKVIYFPVDGQLSEEFANDNNLVVKKDEDGNNIGGYLNPTKRNITALKLRGEKSDGLVLPLEVLSKYVDISTLSDGTKINILNGHEICRKYIPASKTNKVIEQNQGLGNKKNKKNKEGKISYLFFNEHIDTSQLAYNQEAFKQGDTCYITLKMHGTSQRTMNAFKVTKKTNALRRLLHIKTKVTTGYEIVSGTRRTVLRSFNGGYYGDDLFRKKYHDMLKDRLPKGMEIFYEIVGWVDKDRTIMGKCSNKLVKDKEFSKQYGDETVFSYGCDVGENDCYVYRMTMTNEDGI